ncbi:protein kinase [Gemmata sp. JC717]|uniref:serine/threonine protein kinase n=1 Tax=Gemmata algarum TaxID=2975278 RepID=UPI0021BADA09|nr:serine/threonine-protein kinase [Gemmata algarum]MDY3556969.1 protein kinase [Gemmata algarum]
MSVPSSVEELLQLIRKSGMVDEAKLTAYLQRRQVTRGLPADSREFADELVQDGIITYFQSEQFMLGKWRGFTIGKFKLLERVGVGGMGQVFLCEHMFMRRRVAVKVLPPAKAEQPAALGRFYREARAAGSLDHPNIVRTHDIDQDGNLHFIVMDYVDGPNLLDVVKRFGPLDLARAVSYVRQVANGLEYAFRNKLIHRDIKPGNILVDRKGVARILDMGLARFLNDHTDQLTIKYDDKIVLGTADYVAPEQVANSHSVDIRADIYGLGATLYFLLAGHPPFPTGTVSQKLLWHRTKDPTPVRQIRPEVPEGLAVIVGKMMAKDPKARFQTPAQVVAELDAYLPASVPLPSRDEMPLLSPAAMEGASPDDEGASEAVAETPLNASATLGSANPVKAAAVLSGGTATVAPPALNPFGTPAAPWGGSVRPKPPSRPAMAPLPQPPMPRPGDSAGPDGIPPAKRSGPFAPSNPFREDAVSGPAAPPRPFPWVLLGAGAITVAVLAALLALKLM